MRIKLWGTRGSLPRALTHEGFRASLLRITIAAAANGIKDLAALQEFINNTDNVPLTYGGNTTCTEIRYRDRSYVVDLGTGLAGFAEEQRATSNSHFCFLLSHLHWDHILGLPFFPPIYNKSCTLDIYHVHAEAPEYLRIKFNGVNFPVRWEELGANINFHRLSLHQPHKLDDLTITPFQLDHPGDAYGYRFDSSNAAVGIAVDNELKRKSADELGQDQQCYHALDVLLFDSQYDMNEMAEKYDWGHSSPALGIDLAFQEMIKMLVLVHHNPAADDRRLQEKLQRANQYATAAYPKYRKQWEKVQAGGPRIITGYDGMEIDVT